MHGNKPFSVMSQHILSMYFILICLTGAVLAQTFHYSSGWTSGRKRSPVGVSVNDWKEIPEILSDCHKHKIKYPDEISQNFESNLSDEYTKPKWKCDRWLKERRKF